VRDLGHVRPAINDNDLDRQPGQLSSHCRQSAEIPGSQPVFDCDVLAVDIAEVSQTLSEPVEYFCV